MYIENIKLKKYISYWLAVLFFLVSIMIVVGGLTRLTDSGLSITEWQLFSGIIPPLNESEWQKYFNLYKKIPEFEQQNFSMKIDEFKIIFWWEWGHRILGRIIGMFFLLPFVFFYLKLGFHKTKSFLFIFLLICIQGFIGWYMVSSGLVDRVDVSHFRLSIHLILAFLILSFILWEYFKYSQISKSYQHIEYKIPLIFLILIFLQITIGAFVAGMDAGKIYNTWPLMGNTYFPDDNLFLNIFSLSAFSEPSLVQFMHRNLAYLIFLYYSFVFFYIYKKKYIIFFKAINLLGVILIIQMMLGILTLIFGAQIIIASMHQISTIFLVSQCVYLHFLNFNQQL